MSSTYTVSAVSPDTKPLSNGNVVYKVRFNETGAQVIDWIRQSPPNVGESATGNLENTSFGVRFKKEWPKQQLAGSSTGGGDDVRRSKRQMMVQDAQHTAALLYGGKDWDWPQIEFAVRKLVNMVENADNEPAYGQPPVRNDSQPTGQSDVPGAAPDEFIHPEQTQITDDIPF